MIEQRDLSGADLIKKIKHKQITRAGNNILKIYGRLDCSSGKRMKMEHRVFFADETEAVKLGYRPCGHCLREEYKLWKCKQESG